MMTKGLARPALLCLIAVAFLVTRAAAGGQQASAIEAKGWPQERKIIKSISIPLSDTSPGFNPVKGSGDVITIAGITDVGDASPNTEGIAGAPLGSNVDPQDLSSPELTIEQLLPSIPTDRGRVGTSGKYPAVQSLQAQHPQHAVNLREADEDLTSSMAQLPSAAP